MHVLEYVGVLFVIGQQQLRQSSQAANRLGQLAAGGNKPGHISILVASCQSTVEWTDC